MRIAPKKELSSYIKHYLFTTVKTHQTFSHFQSYRFLRFYYLVFCNAPINPPGRNLKFSAINISIDI